MSNFSCACIGVQWQTIRILAEGLRFLKQGKQKHSKKPRRDWIGCLIDFRLIGFGWGVVEMIKIGKDYERKRKHDDC